MTPIDIDFWPGLQYHGTPCVNGASDLSRNLLVTPEHLWDYYKHSECVDLVLQVGAVDCRAHGWIRSLMTFLLNNLCSTSRKETSDHFQLDFFVSSVAGSYYLVLMGAKSNDTSISFWELSEAPRPTSSIPPVSRTWYWGFYLKPHDFLK